MIKDVIFTQISMYELADLIQFPHCQNYLHTWQMIKRKKFSAPKALNDFSKKMCSKTRIDVLVEVEKTYLEVAFTHFGLRNYSILQTWSIPTLLSCNNSTTDVNRNTYTSKNVTTTVTN